MGLKHSVMGLKHSVMGLKHSVMGLSPSWPQCGYATISYVDLIKMRLG